MHQPKAGSSLLMAAIRLPFFQLDLLSSLISFSVNQFLMIASPLIFVTKNITFSTLLVIFSSRSLNCFSLLSFISLNESIVYSLSFSTFRTLKFCSESSLFIQKSLRSTLSEVSSIFLWIYSRNSGSIPPFTLCYTIFIELVTLSLISSFTS